MTYKGKWDLEYYSVQEERSFIKTRRMSGFQSSVVYTCYPEEAYKDIKGSTWRQPGPRDWTYMGNYGMAVRYATIDEWFFKE